MTNVGSDEHTLVELKMSDSIEIGYFASKWLAKETNWRVNPMNDAQEKKILFRKCSLNRGTGLYCIYIFIFEG